MKKAIKTFGLFLMIVVCVIPLTACNSQKWCKKDYWYGCYSEIITREYSGSAKQIKAISPTGEREVQFEIVLALYENNKAYFARKLINGGGNKEYDFLLEGYWSWQEVSYLVKKGSGFVNGFVKEIHFSVDEKEDRYYTFAVSRKGGLYYIDSYMDVNGGEVTSREKIF